MKTLISLSFILLLAPQLHAQRWAIQFLNSATTRVTNVVSGAFVTASQGIRAVLYYADDGTTDEALFVPVGASTGVGLVLPAGIYNGGTRYIAYNGPNRHGMFQVRAFEAAYGESYEAAAVAPAVNGRKALGGKSNIVRCPLADQQAAPPQTPSSPVASGLRGFGIDVFPDIPPGPYLTIKDTLVIEGNEGTTDAAFTVQLHHGGFNVVTVDFATRDSLAVAPGDYASTSGTLTFHVGETQKIVTVSVVGDLTPENEETFGLNLLHPVNATIVRAQATGRIYNDDCVTGLTAATYVGVTINGCINKAYRIEVSYDGAITWQGLTNLTLTTAPYIWLDTISPVASQRFYRSVLLAPP